MRTSSTFLWLGVHPIILSFIDRQNMILIVLYLSMIEKDLPNIKQRTVESGKRGERTMNDIEDFVYALYSLLLDYALVDAHDLIRST